MIYSDRQYQITRAELAKLEGALTTVPAAKGADGWVLKAQAEALQSQIADLQAEMAEYDMLKLGKVAFAKRARSPSFRASLCRRGLRVVCRKPILPSA